jgi:guanylate kinase
MNGKIIILSAPSGCGKSTIIARLMERGDLNLSFSISATSRPPRGSERNGVEYYFLSPDEFRRRIDADEFVEYEEVYAGRFYGTLRSEIDRITADGKNVVLDIDVKGAMNVKRIYGDRALAMFILPPSIEELRHRLESRATDAPEVIDERVGKAAFELTFAPNYDCQVVNDNLDTAVAEAHSLISIFIAR